MKVSGNEQLWIPACLRHLAELGADREAFCERVGRDDGGVTAVERIRQAGLASGAAGELDGFAAQSVAAIANARREVRLPSARAA